MNERAEVVAKVILKAIYGNDSERKRFMKKAVMDLAVMILDKLDTHDSIKRDIEENYNS